MFRFSIILESTGTYLTRSCTVIFEYVMINSAADLTYEDPAEMFLFGRRLRQIGADKVDDSSSFKSRSIKYRFFSKTVL